MLVGWRWDRLWSQAEQGCSGRWLDRVPRRDGRHLPRRAEFLLQLHLRCMHAKSAIERCFPVKDRPAVYARRMELTELVCRSVLL